MPLQIPRYSSEPNCEVYHNHTGCTESNNIEKRNFKWGTGNKRLCKHCEKLGHEDGMRQEVVEAAKGLNGLVGGLSLSSVYKIMEAVSKK